MSSGNQGLRLVFRMASQPAGSRATMAGYCATAVFALLRASIVIWNSLSTP
jgi:hypothetical protein